MAKEDPKKILKEVGEEALDIQDSLNSISGQLSKNLKNFNKVTGDTQKIFNSNLKASNDLGKTLAKVNENSLKNAKERKNLSDQLIKASQEIVSLERQRDRFQAKAANARGNEKRALLSIAADLQDAVTYSKEQVSNAERLADIYIDVEKNLGVTGKLLNGINNIPIVGKFLDTEKALKAANNEASKLTGNRWSVLSAALGSLGSSFKKNLTDPLTYIAATGKALSSIFGFIKKSFIDFDKASVNISKNFGTTPQAGRELTHEFRQISANSNNLLSNVSNLSDAFSGLNSVAGTFANFGQESLETYNNLTKGLNLSEGAAQGIYKFSVLQGKEFSNFTNELSGQLTLRKEQSGVALSDKAIYESLTQLSAQQRLNIKGGTQGLIDSVIEAKKLGAEFSDLNTTANSLLQFENSIGAELEAELLTGRNLNLEKARTAALNGDQVTLAKELKAQLGSAADFQKMNVIQQESLAKAFGMGADQVAGMLEKQEMLNAANKAGFKDVDSIAKAYAEAADKEAFLAKIGDDRLKSQVQNLTFQEKINALLEKFKDIFVQKLEPKFTEFLNKFDEFIKGGGVTKIANIVKSVGETFTSIVKALTGPIGKALGLLAGLGALKMLVGGLPVRIVGQGPIGGGGGMGGGLMGSLYNAGTVTSKSGQVYSANSPQGRMIMNMSGQKPVGRGLTGMGAGMIGMGTMMAGQAIGGTTGGLLSNIGMGASMGAMAGPWGALAGAVGGLAVGLIKLDADRKDQRAHEKSIEALKPKNETQERAARIFGNVSATGTNMDRYSRISGAGGETEGVDQTNMLLEKISGQLSEQRDIVMSGNKVGTAVAIGNYQQG